MKFIRTFMLLGALLSLILYTSPSFARTESNKGILLSEVKKKAEFKVLTPQEFLGNWSLVIKPYPSERSSKIDKIRLTYVDKSLKDYMMLGIEQRKADTSLLENRGEVVKIKNSKGLFEAWEGGSPKGGILRWVQSGTYIEMHSSKLTKKEMLGLAQSMQ
ncbi:DUF4367 domain-containing protein [Bacillus cereus]|uniref:DUF4367 domain-containing protein n=2 Tax=Bacillus cereus group TaxID=86661 RepID=A0A9W5NZC1_BACCE|nr:MULTISPECIES: DUF4367 domain-containing protein [Bacillus cereus group]MEB8732294.1 DUF4367 domain-containing protein [Bacillus cereus]EEM44230.1 hypothetical protein bthur0005_60400 [Bacillus thuringiensis serovar pakistani str. T13001]EJR60921.1 hypothetical protein IK5_06069 [Bacillus cereus VD154]KIU74629.1 hypothetical protein C797_11831 [Bacillus thuringiensis Sbt003]MEB8749688.1 DUF4367 domain-containing protein [Bacillus cereus]